MTLLMKSIVLTAAITSAALVCANRAVADAGNNEYEASYSPNDYLLKSFDERSDSIFDGEHQVIDLGADLAIGSDCGRVDFRGTLRATLRNLLDARYFGAIGRNILAASPMLLTCYFSPTWCAILKHTRINANFLSQMRLDQCALIDKFVDTRTEDFYRERQSCVRRQIDRNGGNLENALQSCRNVYEVDLSDWTGREDSRTTTNRLIDSSVKWAGLRGAEASRATDLAKAFVADTVISRGHVSVDYGPRRKAMTPRTHLKDLRMWFEEKICDDLLRRVEDRGGRERIDRIIADRDLREISRGGDVQLLDRQTIESLAYIPKRQRHEACKKLSDAMALSVFTQDMNRSLDLLTVAAQNPNLPQNRKDELDKKRRSLKELVEITLELQVKRNDPLRSVLKEINGHGLKYREIASKRALSADENAVKTNHMRSILMDCADGVMCEGR